MSVHRWMLTLLLLVLYPYLPIHGMGGGEQPEQDTETGKLAVRTWSYRDEKVTWTAGVTLKNLEDNSTHYIEISDRTETTLYELPAGKYLVESKDLLSNGRKEGKDGKGLFPATDFEVKAEAITLLPFLVFYFNTGKDSMGAAQNVPLPDEAEALGLYSGWGNISGNDKAEYTSTRHLPIDEELEAELMKELADDDNARQLLYVPIYKANYPRWPWNPRDEVLRPEFDWDFTTLPGAGDTALISLGLGAYQEAGLSIPDDEIEARRMETLISDWITKRAGKIASRRFLLNNEINSDAIIVEIRHIASSASETDTLYLLITGHFASDIKGRPFLLLTDTRIDELAATALSLRHLLQITEEFPGAVVLLLNTDRDTPLRLSRSSLFTLSEDRLANTIDSTKNPCELILPRRDLFAEHDVSFIDLLEEALDSERPLEEFLSGNPEIMHHANLPALEARDERRKLRSGQAAALSKLKAELESDRIEAAWELVNSDDFAPYSLITICNGLAGRSSITSENIRIIRISSLRGRKPLRTEIEESLFESSQTIYLRNRSDWGLRLPVQDRIRMNAILSN